MLAFNCSPRMGKGNTAIVFDPFLEGMKDAGARVELLYTKRLNIKPCTGEFKCWSEETPGRCYQKDDCAEVLAKIPKADILAFGVPVYVKLPGELQNLFNRIVPLLSPPPISQGRSIVPSLRFKMRLRKIALVSTGSYWGLENFDLLIDQVRFVATVFGVPLARPLLRPMADELMTDVARRESVAAAARKAGAELVREGNIRSVTARTVQRPFSTRRQFMSGLG